MKTIELLGDIDEQHDLRAKVPSDLPVGQVRLIVLVPEEDEAGDQWERLIAAEWADDLADPRQDIYTVDDVEPLNESK